MDTKDFIIIGLSISLFVAISVIIYLFPGRQQMNSSILPKNKEIRTDYYNGRNQPTSFYRYFSEMGGNDGQESIGNQICLGELPKRSYVRYSDGKIYNLLRYNNGTPGAVDGSFTAQPCTLGNKNKRARPNDFNATLKDLDTTENVTFLGKHYPSELVDRDAVHEAIFASDDEE